MDNNYPQFASPFLQELYNWQTLLGAVLALGAALLGAILLNKQIRLSQQHEAERQRRRFAAARARMPLLLSAICSYAHDAADFLKHIHPAAGQLGFGAETLATTVPPLPSDIPAALERLIESTGNDILATKLSDLLGELQVLNARITEIPRLPSHMGGLQIMIEDYMIQAADVYATASSLFAFARREVENANVGQQLGLRSALNLLEMRNHEFERLHETAARRYGGAYSSEHCVDGDDTGTITAN